MFIKASVVLAQVSAATIVPFQAVTQRNGRKGIFVVDETNRSVAWHEVKVGLREDDRLQVEGTGLTGKVVTLGQQMVTDGSAISIAADPSGRTGEPAKAKGQ